MNAWTNVLAASTISDRASGGSSPEKLGVQCSEALFVVLDCHPCQVFFSVESKKTCA